MEVIPIDDFDHEYNQVGSVLFFLKKVTVH
jgi:hypothetical protein